MSRARSPQFLGWLLVPALLLTACYQVPVTGRTGINLVSDAEVARLSIEAFEQTKRRYPLSRNSDHIEQLNRVGERLSRLVLWDMPSAEWEFVVFEVPQQVNAFAMVGGKVGVFSGLFQIIDNEDELASVIAHEIAHVTAKHVHERLSQEMLMNTGGLAAGVVVAASGAPPLTTSTVLNAYNLSSGIQALAFDRKKEKEADYIGLMYMARAGYDPEAAVRVLEKIEQASASQPAPPAWLSTHPSNPERILQLLDAMPKARDLYARGGSRPAPIVVQ